jgi:hypothetical protein
MRHIARRVFSPGYRLLQPPRPRHRDHRRERSEERRRVGMVPASEHYRLLQTALRSDRAHRRPSPRRGSTDCTSSRTTLRPAWPRSKPAPLIVRTGSQDQHPLRCRLAQPRNEAPGARDCAPTSPLRISISVIMRRRPTAARINVAGRPWQSWCASRAAMADNALVSAASSRCVAASGECASLGLSITFKPNRNLAGRDDPLRKLRIDRASNDGKALVKLFTRKLLGFGLGLERFRHARTAPLARKQSLLWSFEGDVPRVWHWLRLS